MLISYLLVASALAAAEPAQIPKGAHVLLRIVNSISTRTAQEGDYVYFRTATPVAENGQIVVPADSYVQGIVTHARRSGRVSGRAELGIRLDTLTLATGKVLKFSPRLSSVDSDESGQKVDIVKTQSSRVPATATMPRTSPSWQAAALPSAAWPTEAGKARASAPESAAQSASRQSCCLAGEKSSFGKEPPSM